jgi:hypothetical protein
MKPTVYLETTIISYLTARVSRDLYVAALQQRTAEWWQEERHQFELVSSELTRIEASAGNAQAADARMALLDSIPLLAIKDEATALAEQLVMSGAFPAIAARDALHVAICATNGVRYLLTWNFKHLANVFLRDKITETCEQSGVAAPLICTPDEIREVPR